MIKIIIICLNLCLIQLSWSGLKQSDMAFSDKGFTGEFICAKKGHLWNHEILCDIHLHIKKKNKKEQSAKIPGMEQW